MIYIIHKTLALVKNHLNCFTDSILELFLRSLIDFYKNIFFSQHMMMESPRFEEKNIINDIRNLFKL